MGSGGGRCGPDALIGGCGQCAMESVSGAAHSWSDVGACEGW